MDTIFLMVAALIILLALEHGEAGARRAAARAHSSARRAGKVTRWDHPFGGCPRGRYPANY